MAQHLETYSLLENCLARLNAGEDLESILAQYPQQAAELRPLLTAALKARQSGSPLRIPASAQIDSRTRFLVEARRRQSQPKAFFPRLNFAGALMTALILLFAGIFGTSLASAETVPGEALYPVKRVVEQAQLALTTSQTARLDLEEEFDRRRVAEAEELEQNGLTESVRVAGPLEESDDETWSVGGVKLKLTSEQAVLARTLIGSYIEVNGQIRGEEGIEVESLELRLFTFSGTLEAIQDTEWTVSGVKVLVMESTQITGKPKIGKRVDLTTLRYDEDYFLALTVRVTGGSDGDKPGETDKGGKNSDDPVITDIIDDVPVPTIELTRTPEPEKSEPTHEPEETKGSNSGSDDKGTELTKLIETILPTKTPD
ncbi:MAG: DUF5667 domain-containing protein [Bellilinea sp.]